jgi:hypothetical protein
MSIVPRMERKRLTVNENRVPMNVSRKMRTGMPYQCGERTPVLGAIKVFVVEESGTALIQNGEFKTGVWGKQLADLAQAFG